MPTKQCFGNALQKTIFEVLFQGNFANNNTRSFGDLWQFTAKTN